MIVKLMQKILTSTLLISLIAATTVYSATATKEQQAFINSMTAQQLYDAYAEQTLYLTEQLANNKESFQTTASRQQMKNCIILLLKNIFNEHEMREIYIQPAGMDIDYYQRKINQLSTDLLQCFDGVQNLIMERVVSYSDSNFEIDFKYPELGQPTIDLELEMWANANVGSFLSELKKDAAERSVQFTLYADYDLIFASSNIVSIVWTIVAYAGGAHEIINIRTFCYDMSSGRKLELSDFFKNKSSALSFLSAYSYQQIKQKNDLDVSYDSWIKSGTVPDWGNFSAFAITNENLIIYFEPYQATPWVVGVQTIYVDWSRLNY